MDERGAELVARTEARLASSIWADPEFVAMTGGAQRMFMFLISQSDLAHDGVIALRERRWSKAASDLTLADVGEALTELEESRFVVIDEDTEELLVRSFIRRDKVFRQPNVLRAAASHLGAIASAKIKAAIGVELLRITSSELEIPDGSMSVLHSMLEALGCPIPEGIENPSRKGSEKGSGNPLGERGEGKGARGLGFSRERAREDDTLPGMPAPTLTRRPGTPSTETLFEEFWSEYPRKVGKDAARRAWVKACKRADADKIIAGARDYAADPNREPEFTAHPSTWLNAGRWEDEPLPARSSGEPSKAQQRVTAAADLVASYREKREQAERNAEEFGAARARRAIADPNGVTSATRMRAEIAAHPWAEGMTDGRR